LPDDNTNSDASKSPSRQYFGNFLVLIVVVANTLVEWRKPNVDDWDDKGYRLRIRYKSKNSLKKLTWHHKGDYLATVSPDANNSAVMIHSMSKRQTQSPFKKNKGRVETVKFHPSKPFFFVATQKHIRVYNLAKQQLFKKLVSNVQWISSMDIHPAGDNVIIGSYDKRVVWFDLDFGVKPYKVLRYHQMAVRSVVYHHQFPLFASCSDDGNIHIFHGMVYNDLLQNPMIVPLKILKGHQVVDDLGVLNILFHPTQPWIFSSGSDSTVRLFT
jgi:ribosome biogenesis protein ERB1